MRKLLVPSVPMPVQTVQSWDTGISSPSEPPQEFLDKRVGLADHRTLAYFATFLAYGWQLARETNNVALEAFCGRGTMMVEQMVRDGGRFTGGLVAAGAAAWGRSLPEGFCSRAAFSLPSRKSKSQRKAKFAAHHAGFAGLENGRRELCFRAWENAAKFQTRRTRPLRRSIRSGRPEQRENQARARPHEGEVFAVRGVAMRVRPLLGGVLSIIRSVPCRRVGSQQPKPQPSRFRLPTLPLKEFSGLSFPSGVLHDVQSWVWSFSGICSCSHACLSGFISQSLRPRFLHCI